MLVSSCHRYWAGAVKRLPLQCTCFVLSQPCAGRQCAVRPFTPSSSLLLAVHRCRCLYSQELDVCVGIDVDPVAHATAVAALAPLLTQPGAPMLHQLNGNYR